MSSREKILTLVKGNQPEFSPLPGNILIEVNDADSVQQYMEVFKSIGGEAYLSNGWQDIKEHIRRNYDTSKRIITSLHELSDVADIYSAADSPSSFHDVELAILESPLAVAENGAVWITDSILGQRIIPYICQHLIVIVSVESIVTCMHDAYTWIGNKEYGFGGFIAGPSKTADIEQALVLGAHGPLTMTVFLIDNDTL